MAPGGSGGVGGGGLGGGVGGDVGGGSGGCLKPGGIGGGGGGEGGGGGGEDNSGGDGIGGGGGGGAGDIQSMLSFGKRVRYASTSVLYSQFRAVSAHDRQSKSNGMISRQLASEA